MGFDKLKRPTFTPGVRGRTPTVISSTGTLLPRYGSVKTSTANLKGKVFRLSLPTANWVGSELTVINTQPGSSKGAFKVQAGPTTASNFLGSTNGLITMTSGKKNGVVRLLAASTSQWAIVSISTGITVAG